MLILSTDSLFLATAPLTPLNPNTDVVFLLDASKGVTLNVYQMEKDFIVSMATQFNVSQAGPRAAVIMYDSFAYTLVRFNETTGLKDRVDKALLLGLPRRMDEALQQALRMLTKFGRVGRKIVILLTAGLQAVQPNVKSLSEAVMPLKELGVQTFVIAIGLQLNDGDIVNLVDRRQDIFRVSDARYLIPQAPHIARKIRDKPGKKGKKPTYFITWDISDLYKN